jgi:molybdopterin molybdotransferase
VAIVSTGDEVVAPATEELAVGQVRDATATALAALVREAGGDPDPRGIVPDDHDALAAVLRDAIASSDLVVVSAGSSVGARDETAAVVAGLGPPGIWAHGIALRPGKPTLLADCGGVPVLGLPGNPRSALVVFRIVGMPIVRLVGGVADPPEPRVRARLARSVPSAAGRLDVVQVTVRDGVAAPLFGASALLTILTAADGYIVVPDEATGLPEGSEVDVTLYT